MLIREFFIKIPRTEKSIKVPPGFKVSIEDLPGIDDAKWYYRINNSFKNSQGASVIPIILINLTQGTFNLSQNQEIKQIFNSKDSEKMILVVFTKISSAF